MWIIPTLITVGGILYVLFGKPSNNPVNIIWDGIEDSLKLIFVLIISLISWIIYGIFT